MEEEHKRPEPWCAWKVDAITVNMLHEAAHRLSSDHGGPRWSVEPMATRCRITYSDYSGRVEGRYPMIDAGFSQSTLSRLVVKVLSYVHGEYEHSETGRTETDNYSTWPEDTLDALWEEARLLVWDPTTEAWANRRNVCIGRGTHQVYPTSATVQEDANVKVRVLCKQCNTPAGMDMVPDWGAD